MPIRYTHTNLIAHDWRRLSAFYQHVLGCVPVPPERHLRGAWLAAATGVAGAELQGQHLRLPGYGETGPTLEIFQYTELAAGPMPSVNRPGLAHLAFAVEDVAAMRAAVLAAGGGVVGEVVTTDIAQAGQITFAYVSDPEGNLIELQRWLHG
jgi:catechol 2,3-dioxygenase-like lactoylglutathione lyase family enzyme